MYLKLKYLKLRRTLANIGWFYSLFLIAFVNCFYYFIYISLAESLSYNKSLIVVFCHLLLLFFIHTKRKDLEFIKIVFKKTYKLLLVEYFFYSIPIMIIFLILDLYILLSLYAGITLLIPLINEPKIHPRYLTGLISWIPKCNFEYRSGIRRLWLLFFVLFGLGIFLAFYKYLVLIPLIFSMLLLPIFYERYEPDAFILYKSHTPSKFLIEKVRCHFLSFVFFCVPQLLLSIILGNITLVIALIFLFLAFISIAWLIVIKYVYYTPNATSLTHRWVSSLVLLGVFPFPVFVPVVFILIITKYPQSILTLKKYLHD